MIRLFVGLLVASQMLAATCKLEGSVQDETGKGLPGVGLRLYASDSKTVIAGGTDKNGTYSLIPPDSTCTGTFALWAGTRGREDYRLSQITLAASAAPSPATPAPPDRRDITLYPSPAPQVIFLAWCVVIAFSASLLIFRWHNVASLDRKLLLAEIADTRMRLASEVDQTQHKDIVGVLIVALNDAEKPFRWPGEIGSGFWAGLAYCIGRVWDFLLWTRGQEMSGWLRLREIQRQHILLWDADSASRVTARMQRLELDLRALSGTDAIPTADSVRDALANNTGNFQLMKQVLAEGMAYLSVRREDTYARMTVWQTKAAWLILVGLMVLMACVYLRPSWAVLFLMGAAGGLLSRLARGTRSADVELPTDYGSSWATLFLSPVSGAFSGWFGFLLIVALSESGVLNAAIRTSIMKDATPEFTANALAFLLGFSERAFDSVVNNAASRLTTPVLTPSLTTTSTTLTASTRIDTAVATGGKLTVTGAALDAANVTGGRLKGPTGAPITLTPESGQTSSMITFTVPPNTPPGIYTLELLGANGVPLPATRSITL